MHCGEKGHIFSKESCQLSEAPPKCANCQGCHRADSPTCPEFAIQKEIRKFAAYRNVSLLDAREIFKVADPSCPCGAPRQDVDHVFWGCPRFNGPRTTLLSQLRKFGKIPPLKTQDILKNPFSGVIHALHAFLKSSNLNI